MGKFEEDIKTLMDAMLSCFEKETIERHKEQIKKLKEMHETDKGFLDKIEHAQHDFNRILGEVINIPEQKNMYILEHVLSGLYEHFINTLMTLIEGSGCSADKSRFIKNMTLKALKENTNLSLFDDYTKCEEITEDKERQAYWSPKTIPDTSTAMELFWNWYLLRVPARERRKFSISWTMRNYGREV